MAGQTEPGPVSCGSGRLQSGLQLTFGFFR